MPAFFAYLLSISVFLGGAYAGLNWIANPPLDKAAVQRTGIPNSQPHLKRKFEVATPATFPVSSTLVMEENAEIAPERAVVADAKSNGNEINSKSIDETGAPHPTGIETERCRDVEKQCGDGQAKTEQ